MNPILEDREAILARATELSPWHFDHEILPGITTGSFNRADYSDGSCNGVATIDPNEMMVFFRKYYPNGLGGKTLLDVACNSGAYCFLAHTLGVKRAVGVEVRQRWLDQAEFVRSIKYPGSSNVEFHRQEIQEYLCSANDSFDITIFKGIFYHLPNPIGVLDKVCEMTRETILIDTASSENVPETCLTPISESVTHVMSGVNGLGWLPGGPAAIRPILKYKGFAFIEVQFFRRGISNAGRGRFRIIGSRAPL
jgi:SAM-dependent methyltransferase